MGVEIIVGERTAPLVRFGDAQIRKLRGDVSVDLVSDSLSVDNLTPIVRYEFVAPRAYVPSNASALRTRDGKVYCCHFTGEDLSERIPAGTKMHLINDGDFWGTFYVDGDIERQAGQLWKIPAVSITGLFDKQEHHGGIYTGQSFAEVLTEIFGGTLTENDGETHITGGPEECTVDAELAQTAIHNWLPYDSKRRNLHQLLIATGASMVRDNAGALRFCYLKDLEAEPIEKNRLYRSGSVRKNAGFRGVELTEHTYQFAATERSTTVFDNTDAYAPAADRTLVKFGGPVNPETARASEGVTIHEIGANYAVVSGKGTVEAIPYVHVERTLKKAADGALEGEIKKFGRAYLVNALNSENVLERLYSFYAEARKTTGELIVESERPGRAYNYTNAFDERAQGRLTKLNIEKSSFLHGEFEMTGGWTPGPFGNNYNSSVFLTGSGEWIIPQEKRTSAFPYIRLVLIGGGEGSDGGEGGEQGRGTFPTEELDSNGDVIYEGYGGGRGGRGGKGGGRGEGGKVLSIVKLDARNVAKIVYKCGAGGTAGQKGIGGYQDTDPGEPTEGTAGNPTTISLYNDAGGLVGSYSSDDGYVLPSGVLELTSNTVYALPGFDGVDGGDAGEAGAAAMGSNGTDGESVEYKGESWAGGKGSLSEYDQIYGTDLQAYCGGGSGGGAAVGAAGGDAPTDGRAEAYMYTWGGDGGHGADAGKAPTKPEIYGQGGDGGHGGGGGGSGGAQNWRSNGVQNTGTHDGLSGPGGDGTPGAPGADGCIFAYL